MPAAASHYGPKIGKMSSYFTSPFTERFMERVTSRFLTPRAGRPALAAAALLLFAAGSEAAAVSGTVTDATSGLRLTSMIVRAYKATGEDPGLLTTTDSNGRYILSLAPGDYRILAYDQAGVYATSFAGDADSFETSAVFTANADATNYNFALKPGGTVTGRVVSGSTPVRQAVVAAYNLSGTRRGFTVADLSGNYSIVLPPGKYKMVAYDNNKTYAPTFYRFALSFAEATPVDVVARTTTAAVDFVLPRSGRITGFVVDAITGEQVKGLLISAYDKNGELITSQQMTTDQFDLALPAGTYRLVIADTTHLYAPAFFDSATSFEKATALTVGAGELRAGLRFEVVPAAHISGRALTVSGQPIPSITVSAYNLDGSLRTSADTNATGEYSLDLPPGAFKVVAFDEALVYAPQFYLTSDTFRTATNIALTLGQNVPLDFRMELGGLVTGKIRDAASGSQLSSITVGAYNGTGDLVSSGKSNDDGDYRLIVPAGAYRLAASDDALRYAAGYVGASAFEPSAETAVAAGATATVDFQLSRGVLLSGTVTDTSQRSVSGIEIGVLDADGNRVATGRSKDGRFDIVVLPGTYKLFADDPAHRYLVSFYNGARTLEAATPVTITKEGPPPSVAFVLTPAARRRAASP